MGSLVTSASAALELMEKRALSPLDGANRILACLRAFGASLARASATAAATGHPAHGTAGGGHFLAPVVVTPAPAAPEFPPWIPLPTSTPLRESHGPPKRRPIHPQTQCGGGAGRTGGRPRRLASAQALPAHVPAGPRPGSVPALHSFVRMHGLPRISGLNGGVGVVTSTVSRSGRVLVVMKGGPESGSAKWL